MTDPELQSFTEDLSREITFWRNAYLTAQSRDLALVCFGAYTAMILLAEKNHD